MVYLPGPDYKVHKRALLRPEFWEDHLDELALYARGRLKDVMRPVGRHVRKRLRRRKRMAGDDDGDR